MVIVLGEFISVAVAGSLEAIAGSGDIALSSSMTLQESVGVPFA